MARHYVALIHPPTEGAAWRVTFPDFPACTAAGDSFEAANINAAEALRAHVAGLIAKGAMLPRPRTYERILAGRVFRDAMANGAKVVLVHLVDASVRKKTVSVMLDPLTLLQIDQLAREEGLTRSAFVERALLDQLK